MSSTTDRPSATALKTIDLTVNGQVIRSAAITLDKLLLEAGYPEAKVATALNGDFVPHRARSTTRLADGDRIEIVSPRQGG